MNYRFTVILLAVLLVLGGYVYYSEVLNPQKASTTDASMPQIFSFDGSAIQQIEVSQGNKKVVVSKSDGGVWTINEPNLGPADSSTLESMTSRIGGLNASRLLTNKADDLSTYGLDKPQFQLTVTLDSGNTATLLFGNENPNGTNHYAKLADSDSIYLVYSSLGEDLQKWLTNPPVPTPTPTPFPTFTPVPQSTPAQ